MNREAKRLLKALEQFARLADSEDAKDGFKAQWPDFFPATFWIRRFKQVPPGVSMSGPAPEFPDIPMWRAWQDMLIQAWRMRFPLSDLVRLIVAPVVQEAGDALSSMSEWSYQRAVLLMTREPWRARHCLLCGRPFAADKGASKFCSNQCFAESRLDSKRRWWAQQGSERRRTGVKQSHGKGRKSA
jgi:predicted nucleic acid-binding Zn ribbon protein